MNKFKDIMPENDNGERHGYWEVYHEDGDVGDYLEGDLWYKCTYHNNIEVGYDELHQDGVSIYTYFIR